MKLIYLERTLSYMYALGVSPDKLRALQNKGEVKVLESYEPYLVVEIK